MNQPSDRSTSRLLLIDDDPNLVLLIKDYLEFEGYKVQVAKNGQQALELMDSYAPHLVICDIMMPELDGYGLVTQLRAKPETDWIPVIFLSAKGQREDRIKGLTLGADVYMTKPFEPEELIAQVESCLKQAFRLMKHANNLALPLEETVEVDPAVKLTKTEMKVIALVAQGLGNREVAEELKVSQRTVESHVSNMLHKTRLPNRTMLARWAIESNRF
ncbi:MAG: response regulator transcription factor [Synechococcaceae cyanobacterium RL_1_2]|nr:response regulator transcription factor [Synechococcaceae cyanobacterium RL_1_2]